MAPCPVLSTDRNEGGALRKSKPDISNFSCLAKRDADLNLTIVQMIILVCF